MPQFTNQARLTYNDSVTVSNVAVGEIADELTITKTALTDSYSVNDSIVYVVSIINSGSTSYNALTVTDNLGAYQFNNTTLVPLDYVDGSLKYYINGVLQPDPAILDTPFEISGISVPAGGSTILVYESSTNEFAPINDGGQITNTATLSGTPITDISASETVTSENAPSLSIEKSISPIPVAPNGAITYTFIIRNTGSAPIVATDGAILTDTFDPLISNLSVTFNGTPWQEGTNYTYDSVSGLFSSVAGEITVPAATYTQAPTGEWSMTPGTSTLVISGTILQP